MRLLIFSPPLYVGGTQINAVELAEALRDHYGYEVTLFAASGILVPLVNDKQLNYIEAPAETNKPWLDIHRSLSEALDTVEPDLVHVWAWQEYLHAYYPAVIQRRIPLLVTDMLSDKMFRGLPRYIMTTFGTAELAEIARKRGRRKARELVPPVDIHANSPDAKLPPNPLESADSGMYDFTVVTVTRVAELLKGESIERTMHSVAALAEKYRIRFFLAGVGDAFDRFRNLASEINSRLGRTVIVMPGELEDPRPVYAMADIVVGMGGSAIRGLAFAKPVIVVGKDGFAKLVSSDTAEYFLYKGFYGIGDGDTDNATLIATIVSLLESETYRQEVSTFARSFAEEHYSIETVCCQLKEYCESAIARPTPFPLCVLDGLRTFIILGFSSRGLGALLRRVARIFPYRRRR